MSKRQVVSVLAVGVCVLAAGVFPLSAEPQQSAAATVTASGDRPIITETGAASPNAAITSIAITGLSDSARDQLMADLRVHVGDILNLDGKYRLASVVKQFDERLSIEIVAAANSLSIRIAAPAVANSAGGAPVHMLNPPPSAPGVGRILMGSGVKSPKILLYVQPVYPQSARQACIQGVETLHVVISAEGTIKFVQAVSGHPILTPAAMEAVRKWIFQPPRVNGEPVEVERNFEVTSALQPGSAQSLSPPCPDSPGQGGHE